MEIESVLRDVNDLIVSSHASFEQVKSQLRQLQSLVLLSDDDSVSIEAVPTRTSEILSKAEVQIGTFTGAKIPLYRHGEGTQSLAVLMLFFAFLKSHQENTSILALEEPEAHLHPSAIRILWTLIQDFANQRLISTHSGELISEIEIGEIRRLARTPNGIQVFQVSRNLLSDEETRKFNYHIRRTRGELLFARCWLLVEGQSEAWIYEAAARACNMDLHREGIRIVEFQQLGGIEMLLKVANCLGIEWYCVGDNDKEASKIKPRLQQHLNDANEADRFDFPYTDIEWHLLTSGFDHVCSSFMPDQNLSKITVSPDDPKYWEEYHKNLPRKSWFKIKVATKIALDWESPNPPQVTPEIRKVLEKVISLAKGKTSD